MSMFCVYAVQIIGETKHREYIGVYESLEQAKHTANCCTLGTADYAYIKDTQGGTVFFIRAPKYDEVPLDPANPPRHLRAYVTDSSIRKCHRLKNLP
jgi:hypothetical protein